MVSETTALLAGASPLPWGRAVLAASFGILPQAVLYGLAVALAASLFSGALVFLAVVAATASLWLVLERPARRRVSPATRSR